MVLVCLFVCLFVYSFVYLLLFTSFLDELISKTLHVDQKKFYIDLKENSFGKFIKIIEVNNKHFCENCSHGGVKI